ncbi:tetratricopeptide repeat protein [Microvenator marinus]|uniref:Tetratricopeptide repeat protein n=1 Tax=Microvenator marinus TaxID=2600177 RepID=A0A5B8XUB2_9DELT|nr:tetratricopeptide repeat protein [Microvenator marinus]QED28717.1 tetratricopeptide repeat protein [Microvenator marinus]
MHKILILAALLTIGCDKKEPAPEPPTKTQTTAEPAPEPAAEAPKLTTWEGTDADSMLKALQASIAHNAKKAQEEGAGWLELEREAKAHMALARLIGSYDPYKDAEAALKTALDRAKKGSGPILTQADLHFTLHQFAKVEPLLAQVEARAIVPDGDRAAVIALRADILVSRGEYDKARALYDEALKLEDSSGNRVRIGHLERYRGNMEEAEKWFTQAQEAAVKDTKFQRAWTQLQAGIFELEREHYDKALELFELANATFSGWYLILEHIAEIHAIKENYEKAESMYREILNHVPSPEFMDALAGVLDATERPDEAKEWRAKATAAYREQLEKFPEAAYGHALEHFIETDPKFAVELAEKNLAVRPGPEAEEALKEAKAAAEKATN